MFIGIRNRGCAGPRLLRRPDRPWWGYPFAIVIQAVSPPLWNLPQMYQIEIAYDSKPGPTDP